MLHKVAKMRVFAAVKLSLEEVAVGNVSERKFQTVWSDNVHIVKLSK